MKAEKGFPSSHSFSGLFVFGLMGLFALLSLMLVVSGTQAYRNVVAMADGNSQARAVISYVTNKVRAADASAAVTLQEREGVTTLALRQDFDGETYETRIYWYNGGLWEQFVPEEEAFFPEDGEMLIPTPGCEMAWEGENLFRISATLDSGQTLSTHVALRAGPAKEAVADAE